MMNDKITSGKALHEKRIDLARGNLLAMLLLTVANIIILLFTAMDVMFPFSASIPYYYATFAFVFDMPLLYSVTAVFLLIYLTSWFFSKKHFAWLVASIICYVIDTVYLIYTGIDIPESSIIIDLVFHVWVLFYLILGTVSGFKIKGLPAKAVDITAAENDTLQICVAEDVKHRVLSEADYGAYHIIYRRVKSTNELVINGYVYDRIKSVIETSHTLNATIDKINFSAGYDGAYSFISVNGKTIEKKRRWW